MNTNGLPLLFRHIFRNLKCWISALYMYEKAFHKDTLIEINCKALRLITGLSHFKFRRAELRGDRVVAEIESTRSYGTKEIMRKSYFLPENRPIIWHFTNSMLSNKLKSFVFQNRLNIFAAYIEHFSSLDWTFPQSII